VFSTPAVARMRTGENRPKSRTAAATVSHGRAAARPGVSRLIL